MKKDKSIFNKYIVSRDGIIKTKDGELVKIFKSNKYLQCCLFDIYGNKHTLGVHTVISMFHDVKWYDGCVVHHKDGNTYNNNIENLEVTNRSFHTKRHHTDGTLHNIGSFASKFQSGASNPNAKAVRCVELNKIFSTARQAEKEMGVHHTKISACCHGKAHTTGGYHWEFV